MCFLGSNKLKALIEAHSEANVTGEGKEMTWDLQLDVQIQIIEYILLCTTF